MRFNSSFFYEDSVPIYSEDFEGDHNWTFVNDTTNKWYVGEAVSNGTGTKALYISNDEGVSYAYTIAGTQVSHAYKDIDIPEGTNDISIDFDWKCVGETLAYDRFRIWVVPDTLVPIAGTELLASDENIQIGRPNYNGNDSFLRENLIVDATPYAGTTVRVVFEWRNDMGGGTQPPAAIDNIEVSVITCSIPTLLILNEVTSNSLIIGWTAPSEAPSGYELFYSESDSNPTDDIIPSISSITTTSQEVTGLEPNTEYFVWVRSVCGDDDKSKWVGPLIVQTTCAAITALPFVETFSSTSTTKTCWSVIDENEDGVLWDLNYPFNAFVGNRVAYIGTFFNSGNNDDWLISPTIVLTGNQRLKYHYRVQLTSEPNDFRVMLSTSGSLPENFTEEIVPLATYDNVLYVEKIVYLLDANGDAYTGEVNIAWHVPQGDTDGWGVYIDNVIIEDIPSCPDPSNILLSNILETETTINWTVGFNETQWEVFVQPAGAGSPTTNGTLTTTNSYTASGLNHSTQYEVYIRAVCGEDDKSNWVGPISFTTAQIPIQLPYTEDFEGDVGFSLNNDVANAWVIGTAVHNGLGTSSMYVSKDNGISYEYVTNVLSVSHAYRDFEIPENTQEISISFDWRCMGFSTYFIDAFNVWLVPISFTPEAGNLITASGTERVQVGQINYSGSDEFLRENIVAEVSAFAGQNMRLVFEWRNSGVLGIQPPAAIDNLNVAVITCGSPTNFNLGVVAENSIGVSWNTPLNAGSDVYYDFFLGTTDLTPDEDTVPTHTSTETNYVFDNLTPDTEYYIWIRTNCNDDGVSFWIGPLSTKTPQVPAQLPYVEDFEGNVDFSLNDNATNAWVLGTAVHNGQGTTSMYVSKDNGVSYEYDTSLISVSHAYRDIAVPENTQEISISFDWKCMGDSIYNFYYDTFNVWLVPISYVPQVGTQITANRTERVQIGRTNYGGNDEFLRENIVADVSDFAGQNVRLVFEWRNDYSGGNQPPAAIDNLSVDVIICSTPTNFFVNAVTENSIGISWSAPLYAGDERSYDVFFGTTDQTPNENSVPTHTSTDTNFTFDNLTPDTEYYIWIRTNCNEDGTSFWIGPFNVRTSKNPEQLPYIENFEEQDDWTYIGDVNSWVVGTAVSNGGTHSLYVSKNEGLTHEYDINSASVSHAYRDFFIEDLSGELSIEFDWICVGSEFFGFKDDYFNVWLLPSSYSPVAGVQIGMTNHYGYKIVDRYLDNDTFLTEHIVFDLDENFGNDSISGNFRIVFEWINGQWADEGNIPAAIDNLQIEKVTCPSVLNAISEINEETGDALLTWEPRGEEIQWEVYIIPLEGEEPNVDSVGIIVDEPQYIFQDGNVELFYKYFVRPICSEDNKGLWAVPIIISFVKPPGCAKIDVDLEVTELDLTPNINGDYVICLDEPVHINLDATYYNIPTTTSYTVEAIDYRPPFPFLGGIEMPITSDDDYTASFDLPFKFCFFGNSYDFCRVGDNGVITFGLPYTETYGEYCPWSYNQQIPNTTFPIRNAIYGIFQDMYTTNNPGENSVINYQVIGKYPCRTFVVNFNEIPAFSCSEEEYRTTTQMVLYEITNIIEIYVKKRVACASWNNGNGVLGIQNEDGTLAYTPPGRNTGAWEATEEAWRFSPSGESSVQFVWQKDGEFFSNDTSIEVTVDESVRYSAVAIYEGCGEVVEVIKDFNFIKDNFDIENPKDLEDCNRMLSNELNNFNLRENDGIILKDLDSANYSIEYFLNESDLEEEINPLPNVYETSDPGIIYVKLTNLTTGCFKTASFSLIVLPPLQVTELEDHSVCDSFELPILKEGEVYYTEPHGKGKKYEAGNIFNEIGVHTIYIYKETEKGCVGQSKFTLEVIKSPLLDVIEDQLLSCETFKLPIPSDNNTYFTESEGKGIELEPGEEIIFPTTIYIYAKKEGTLGAVCIKEGSFRVDYEECSIPKGISPNGDGMNDFLDLTGYGVSDIKIYNRFGIEVYSHGLGYTNQWYGQDKSGNKLPDGTYYYVLISYGKVYTGWIQINK